MKIDSYNYGARFYDPALGRWHVPDPMTEKYFNLSPYTFCANNPISIIDPNGMELDGYRSTSGSYKWFENETDDIILQEDQLWYKISDNKDLFFYEANRNIGGITDAFLPNGSISKITGIDVFESWLEEPASFKGEGLLKVV